MRSPGYQSVFIVDDDDAVRDSLGMLLESEEIPHQSFPSADAFLDAWHDSLNGCLVVDIKMPGRNGLELQAELRKKQSSLPIIFITGHGDLPMAVEAMRQGATDFMRKPVDEENLLERIRQALEVASNVRQKHEDRQAIEARAATLTERENEIFELVTLGHTNKAISIELKISERTVEVHRSNAMKKMDAKTMADLVRMKISME